MHEVSQTYRDILQGFYQTENALVIGGSDLVHICTDEELRAQNPYFKDTVKSMKTSYVLFDDSEKPIGNCKSSNIKIVMHKPETVIPRQARLVPYVRIVGSGKKSEWIPKGVFYTDTRRESPGANGKAIIELEGFDCMMKTEQLYKESAYEKNADDIQLVNEIAEKIGVSVDQRTTAVFTKGFRLPRSSDYTYRETLGFAACLYGGNFTMSDTGELLFIPLKGGAGNA